MISADAATLLWADDVPAAWALPARLADPRGSLHLGVGSGREERLGTTPAGCDSRPCAAGAGGFRSARPGAGAATLLCLHARRDEVVVSPTGAALGDEFQVVAGLPGSGIDKPIGAPYNSAWFARTVLTRRLARSHRGSVGNSMGGRIALEAGMPSPTGAQPDPPQPRAGLARDRRGLLVRVTRPTRACPPAPRWAFMAWSGASCGGDAAGRPGMDEFLRAYLSPLVTRRVPRVGAQHLPRRAAATRVSDPAAELQPGTVRLGPMTLWCRIGFRSMWRRRSRRLVTASFAAGTCPSSSGRARRTRRCASS